MDGGPYPQHSLFTGCLIEALRGGLAASGLRLASGSDIGLYVQHRVRTYPSSTQTPDFGAFELDDRGEILVPLLGAAAATPVARLLETNEFAKLVGRPSLVSITTSRPTQAMDTTVRRAEQQIQVWHDRARHLRMVHFIDTTIGVIGFVGWVLMKYLDHPVPLSLLVFFCLAILIVEIRLETIMKSLRKSQQLLQSAIERVERGEISAKELYAETRRLANATADDEPGNASKDESPR